MPQAPNKPSGQEQHQAAQSVPYPFPNPQQFEDDTIDWYELWLTLWNRKWLIIVVTVVAALGGIVFTLQMQLIYRAEALLLPPKASDIQSLNIVGIKNVSGENTDVYGNPNLTGTSSVENIFNKFKNNLKSRTLHKKFIHEKDLMELLAPERTTETGNEDFYEGFAGLIKLSETNSLSLSVELHDAEIAAQLVNDLTEFVNKETVDMVVANLQNTIANQIRDIEYIIASKRHMAKQRREDTILRYEEAAVIATKLGVMDRVDSTNIVQNNQLNISTTNVPLYFRGYRALNAEIGFLKNRKSDDPFISGLRDLQERHALMQSITLDREKMNAVFVDRAAYPPTYPIKPNRRLIVSVSTVFGFFSGILLAFFIEFIENQRKKHLE